MNNVISTRVVFLAAGMGIAAWAPLIPLVKADLNIDAGELGFLLLFLGFGSIVSMPITGFLTTLFGCRKVIISSGIFAIVSLPLLILAPNVTQLGFMLFIFGASIGTVDVAMNIQAVEVEKNTNRNLMSGFHGFFSLGGIFGAAGVSILLYLNFSALAACLIISFILSVLFLFSFSGLISRHKNHGDSDSKKIVFPRGIIIVASLLCFLMGIIEGSVIDWSGVFLVSERNIDISFSGFGYAAFAAAMTIGRFMGDRVISKIGRGKVFFAGTLSIFIGFLIVVNVGTLNLSMIGFFFIGLGSSNIVPILCSISGTQKVMLPSHAVASIVTFGYFGIMIGPALIGFIAQSSGLETAFYILAIGALIMVANTKLIKKH
ncbi:MFS transporter [Xenorhabdus bovienii]|uniref:Putative membrane protein n=1 Tax=Xenorhabdus bovienii str. kraussei Becker Underwood TaxID=1398204 RepID=A0A077Q2B6_XENBV|nr:MFS transporter [Xenorhabdus bovienii]CDH26159.1 putative membrane protein [Xenorhabdus bovienii str. kraussei Becker Underwood]